ncbi:MAG: M15 family metallopeptidase [Micropruina sp.]|uniref:M15 family metallopeptidase n=1 Tax=Micropruina sp. TaxID=2737536 RepID=UPI0039E5F4FE
MTIGVRAARRVRQVRALACLTILAVTALAMTWLAGLWAPAGEASGQDKNNKNGLRTVLLVNADHPLPDDYQPPKLVKLAGTVAVSGSGVTVASEVAEPLRNLVAAAKKAGLTRLYVASGYRTPAEQRRLWQQAEDKSYVQRPGHSEHQTGLAVDLADLRVGDGEFGDSRAGRWLADNAWRYGFVLRYPPGKEKLTGISYEPWHYRYVGRAVARTCHDRGLVLEEYVMQP